MGAIMSEQCDKYLHILHFVPGYGKSKSVYQYDEIPNFSLSGASYVNEWESGGNSSITTECSEETVATQLPHILKVNLHSSWGLTWSREDTIPLAPQYNVKDGGGDRQSGTEVYYINNERSKPDFWLGIPGEKYEITEFSLINTTGNDPFGHYLTVWLGEPSIIDEWIRRNSSIYTSNRTIDLIQQHGGWKMGTVSESLYQYTGMKVGCRIAYADLLAYPFCGTNNVYRNLCSNPLGLCEDCCDCCKIGERFLQAFKMPL
jgi:hypothetical protein